jgi:hypothetical protein
MKRSNLVRSLPLVWALAMVGQRGYADPVNNQIIQTRPIELGTSGGNIKDLGPRKSGCCSGTLGALVEDSSGNFYILSCNHVLARENEARRGVKGDIITQPGLIDADCLLGLSNAVGRVTTFVPLKGRNKVDAAIAKITSTNDVDVRDPIIGIGQPSTNTFVPPLGAVVQKSGRTTGLTSGYVAAIDATVTVAYMRCNSTARKPTLRRFDDQIVVAPATFGDFSQGGDSGSLVVENTDTCPRVIGLLFAGADSATVVNPISEVLSELSLKLKGVPLMMVGCAPDPAPSTARAAQGQAHGLSAQSYVAATAARTNHQDKLLGTAGVVGVGIGRQQADPSQPTVEILVEKDTPELRAALPSSLDGIPCHVFETGQFVAR